jgi:hypothetical protein
VIDQIVVTAHRVSKFFERHRLAGHLRVLLRLDDHLVSILMTQDELTSASSKDDVRQLSWLPCMNGLGMASLHTPGHVVFIVSGLQDADFRVVAQALAQPVSQLASLRRSLEVGK